VTPSKCHPKRPVAVDRGGKPVPAGRCTTCHRAERKRVKAQNHERRVVGTYGLKPGDYERLKAAQGGFCAIHGCRARGVSRNLAVEHDHATEEVRGLTCDVHNEMIGRSGDNPEVFESLAQYLRDPPARRVLTVKVAGRAVSYCDDQDDA
jgi:hypothetical protein